MPPTTPGGHAVPSLPLPPCLAPGPTPVNQAEIESLYKRFRALDRGRKGYISPEVRGGVRTGP